MEKEPKLTDEIYREILECKPYALLNLITFELTIRNCEVIKILEELALIPTSNMFDNDNSFTEKVEKLKEKYFFNYYGYRDFMRDGMPLDTTLHIRHEDYTSHTHRANLPFLRPLVSIPRKNSYIEIKVPLSHIHPKDIKSYYQALEERHEKIVKDAERYYELKDVLYDEVTGSKSKSKIYSEMFFVWDYVQWADLEEKEEEEKKTKRSLYAELADILGIKVNDRTGRSPKIEKYMEVMTRLIDRCEYKFFYESKSME